MAISIQELYDFEGVISAAVKAVLTAQNLKTVTNREAPNFQEERPRIELVWITGAALHRPLPVAGYGDAQPETCWDGTLQFTVINSINPQNVLNSNGAMVAMLRWKFATLEAKVNEILLPKHCLRVLGEQGSTPTFRPQDDVETSIIILACHLSVQTDALQALLTQFP